MNSESDKLLKLVIFSEIIPSLQFSFLLRGQHVWPVVPLPVPKSDWSLSEDSAENEVLGSLKKPQVGQCGAFTNPCLIFGFEGKEMIWKWHFLLSFHHESLHSTCLLGSETKLLLECIRWWYLPQKALDLGNCENFTKNTAFSWAQA